MQKQTLYCIQCENLDSVASPQEFCDKICRK